MFHRLTVNMTTGVIGKQPFAECGKLGGRGLIAGILSQEINPEVDPLSSENLLVLGTGLLAGTSVPTSGRLSIGAKSPLTGGIKESNVGGTAGFALSRLGIRVVTVAGAAPTASKILVIDAQGNGRLEDAAIVQGATTYETSERLLQHYGEKNAVLCVGPAGEYGYLFASVQGTDNEGLPTRAAGRGGMGTVFAAKGLKAIVISKEGKNRPRPVDTEGFKKANAAFVAAIKADPLAGQVFPAFGTAVVVGITNEMGALPTRNFSAGSFEGVAGIMPETMDRLQKERNGKMTHACQPGCIIQCSNVYNDKEGKYLTGGFEYETIALNGSNLGIGDLDTIAMIDRLCDELGVDTIETGATFGVAMEAGLLPFGDGPGVLRLLEEMKQGSPLGRALGEGTARFGAKKGVKRIPAVKGQSLAAYDPRGLKGTGVTYATSPMGADHTCGNSLGDPTTEPLSPIGQAAHSSNLQIGCAMLDCLGVCLFVGGALAPPNGPVVFANLLQSLYGEEWTPEMVGGLGYETLVKEREFNRKAGFTLADDDVPAFMRTEPLAPHNSVFDVPKEEMEQHCTSH